MPTSFNQGVIQKIIFTFATTFVNYILWSGAFYMMKYWSVTEIHENIIRMDGTTDIIDNGNSYLEFLFSLFLNIITLSAKIGGPGPSGWGAKPFLFRSTMFIAHVHPYGEEQFPWVSGTNMQWGCGLLDAHCFDPSILAERKENTKVLSNMANFPVFLVNFPLLFFLWR